MVYLKGINMKTITLNIMLLSMISLCLVGQAVAAPRAGEVKEQAKEQVKTRQETQKMVDGATEKRLKTADRIETVATELKAIRRQRVKTDAYVADLRSRVSELQRRVVEIERIKEELDPFLDETHTRLSRFVENDLPFLPEERRDRLDTLEQGLNRYGAPITGKVRQLFETLGIEARYGTTVGVSEGEVTISGARKQVRFLRLGRVALFALGLDGRRAWQYDRVAHTYATVIGHTDDLNKASEIAARRRVVELVALPLGSPSPIESRKGGQP
jgi:hypothetical protein